MDGSGWECYHDEQKRVAERDATIAELRAELAQLHSDFSTNAIALGKVAVERNELRADRDALRARCEILEKERARIARCMCGNDAFPGDMPQYVENLVEDFHAVTDRLASAHNELRCPDCKCADQIDAESAECGCDSPVCARDGSKTLAQAYLDALASSRPVPPGHVRDENGVDRRVLGTLPITADGCVIGDGAQVWPRADLYVFQNDGRPSDERPWHPDEEAATAVYCLKENTTGDTIAPEEWHADKVYSSPEAAASAKEPT